MVATGEFVTFRASRWRSTLGRVEVRTVDWAIAGTTLMTYVFLYAPIVILVVFSFNRAELSYSWRGATLNWYRVLLQDEYLFAALRVSVTVGVTSAVIGTAIGGLTAVTLARRRFRGREAFTMLMFMPLILPEIVVSVAFLSLLVAMKVHLGYMTLIAGHSLLALPYSTLILLGAAMGLDVSLEEAASDLGCSAWQVFRRITLPLLLPGILASLLLTFTMSLDDIVMSTFVNGVGTTTLPLRIYSMLKTGITPEINALGSVLVLVNLSILTMVGATQLKRLLGIGHTTGGDEMTLLEA
jgi:putrescine transport system permease protein